MATITPSVLPTVQINVLFTSTSTFAIGVTSVAANISSVTILAFDSSNINIFIGTSVTNSTSGFGSSITISGFWDQAEFNNQSYTFRKTKADSSAYVVYNTSSLPTTYYSLWKYTPDNRATTTINIIVTADIGTFTLTQTLVNNWDAQRIQFQSYLKKSTNNVNDK